MLLEISTSEDAPMAVLDAFRSGPYQERFYGLTSEVFGSSAPKSKPAEYNVRLTADLGPSHEEGLYAVIVRLTGVSRLNRTPRAFHHLQDRLKLWSGAELERALAVGERAQLGIIIELDGDVPSKPSGPDDLTCTYSSRLEHFEWVEGCGDVDSEALERMEAEEAGSTETDEERDAINAETLRRLDAAAMTSPR